MHVLVYWDNDSECELIALYLRAADHRVTLTSRLEELLACAEQSAQQEPIDAVLLACDSPDPGTVFEAFCRLKRWLTETPIVGACRDRHVYRMAQFLTDDMSSYLVRDTRGDFIFMLTGVLENAVEQMAGERELVVSEKLRSEMDTLRWFQQHVLPGELPQISGLEFTLSYEPAELHGPAGRNLIPGGGDICEVCRLAPELLTVVIGDASANGVKACLLSLVQHALLTLRASPADLDPAAFVTQINRHLCNYHELRDEGGFLTLLYGALNLATYEFHWASAGHPLPVVQSLTDGQVAPLGTIDDAGLPLGTVAEADYDCHRIAVPPGSRLVLYTDGLEDASPYDDPEGLQYGIDGIIKTLADSRDRSLSETAQALLHDSDTFTQGAGRLDDATVLLIERSL